MGYYQDLLPIGSVVLLKGGEKRVMIVGRIQTKAGNDKIYDYCAVFYPEGLASTDSCFFFDRDAIERIYYIGMQDEEELSFREDFLDQLPELVVRDGQMVPKEEA